MALLAAGNEVVQEGGLSQSEPKEDLTLCAKRALWCSSACTTALHLTCLCPRLGAPRHRADPQEKAPCLAANQVNVGFQIIVPKSVVLSSRGVLRYLYMCQTLLFLFTLIM